MSAPEASSAALVCSRSRYLPLPTIKRERSSMAPMRNGSLMVLPLSPANELHVFQRVAFGERGGLVLRARDDRLIALDRDRAATHAELVQQRRDGGSGRHLAALAIDLDAHGG